MTIKNILHNVKKEANAKHFLQRRVAQHIAINWNKRPRTDKMLSAHVYLSAAKFYSDTRPPFTNGRRFHKFSWPELNSWLKTSK